MSKRLDLSNKLHALLQKNDLPDNVYFQPPSTVQMKYPCIRYELGDISARYADDIRYTDHEQYTLIVIDPNPDSEIPGLLLQNFRLISFSRRYTAENLNHFVLNLYL